MKKLFNIFCLLLSVAVITSCGMSVNGDENDDLAPKPETCFVSAKTSGCGKVFVAGKELTSAIEVEKGTTVILEAIADEGYYFVQWNYKGKKISIDNPYEPIVDSDALYTAFFEEKKTEKVTISVIQTKGGKADVDLEDEVVVEQGTNLILHATPKEGYVFDKWQQVVEGEYIDVSTEKEYEIKAVSDAVYQPVFIKIEDVQIEVESTEGGTASVNGKEKLWTTTGETVTLSATPDEGYIFENWTVDGEVISSESSLEVKVLKDVIYRAKFAKIEKVKIKVSSSKGGNVTINGKSSSDIQVLVGETVVLSAVAEDVYEFVNWTLDNEEVSTEKDFELKVVGRATYKANFVKTIVKYVVRTEATEGGSANVNGKSSIEVEEGESVILTAIAGENYDFVNWTVDGTIVSTDQTFEVESVTSTATYKANFIKKVVKYTVVVESTEGGNATVNGTSSVEVEEGTSVTLSATANSGYEFVNWTANGVEVSTSASFQATISSAITYKANFAKKEVTPDTPDTPDTPIEPDVPVVPDTPDTPSEILDLIDMNSVSEASIYVSSELVTAELWNAVMNYRNGMNPVGNLVSNILSSDAVAQVSYSDIENVFLSRLNMITGKSFRLPTSTEMALISPYMSFTQKVQYVWCSNYNDDVNLYSSEPDSPEIPAIPTTRLVYAKNGAVMSISMTIKSPAIGFVLVSDSY